VSEFDQVGRAASRGDNDLSRCHLGRHHVCHLLVRRPGDGSVRAQRDLDARRIQL
jgi:hypothetical protein